MPEIKIEAAYLTVREPDTSTPARTAHIGSSLLVDLDAAGAVLGIERVGGSVREAELLDVIRWLRAPARVEEENPSA